VNGHVHLANCVGCPQHAETVVVLAGQYLRALTAVPCQLRLPFHEIVRARAGRDEHGRCLIAKHGGLRLRANRPLIEGPLVDALQVVRGGLRLLEVLLVISLLR
jgi:hypothetical protein